MKQLSLTLTPSMSAFTPFRMSDSPNRSGDFMMNVSSSSASIPPFSSSEQQQQLNINNTDAYIEKKSARKTNENTVSFQSSTTTTSTTSSSHEDPHVGRMQSQSMSSVATPSSVFGSLHSAQGGTTTIGMGE
jgi:hypothetical protein